MRISPSYAASIFLSAKPLERLEPMELLEQNRATVPLVPNVSNRSMLVYREGC